MHGRLMGAIGILLMGLFLASGVWAQATPTLVCGEKQAINSITGPYAPLIFMKGTPGTAVVGGVTVNTMTNAHAEDATVASPFYNTGVEIGCKLQNAGGVTLANGPGNGATTVLHLSGSTNAHAELPSQNNYTTNIYLRASSGSVALTEHIGTACAANETELIHLSGSTNAHVESPHYNPAAYTTRICLSYNSGAVTPGPPTNIATTNLGITSTPGTYPYPSGTISYTRNSGNFVFVNTYTTKAAGTGTSNTWSENALVFCVAGTGTDCDRLNNNLNNPDFYKFVPLGTAPITNSFQEIIANTTSDMLIVDSPFVASLLQYAQISSHVTRVIGGDQGTLESQPTIAGLPQYTGLNVTHGVDMHSVLDNGTYQGALPAAFPSLPTGGYTMRVISIALPSLTDYSGTTYKESYAGESLPAGVTGITTGTDLTDNASATTIVVNPPGTVASQDVVNTTLTMHGFVNGSNVIKTTSPVPLGQQPYVANVTQINTGLAATNVQTINFEVACNPNDSTSIGVPLPAPYNIFTTFGQACAGINDAVTVFYAMQNPTYATLFPFVRKVTYWGGNYPTSTNYSSIWVQPGGCAAMGSFFNANTWSSCPTPPAPASLDATPFNGISYDNYPVDPFTTPAGTYRVISATLPASAVLGGNSISEGIPLPGTPSPVGMPNNFASVTFAVLPAGSIPSTCNNNGVCEPALGEDPLTCPNDCHVATPGDVYLLKDISIPQHYKGEQVTAAFTVESKKAIPNYTTLDWQVKDKDGNPVQGLNGSISLQFSGTLTGGKESITTPLIPLEDPANPIVFNAGDTYTMYAKVHAYDDPSNNTGGIVKFDESVIANNSAFKTFTVPQPPQNFNIPDQPWWMSLVIVFAFAGWMLIGLRNAQ